MANTPFPTLGSEDILSAHLNGIQYSIGNIEDVLNLKTVVKKKQTLQPLTDMQEQNLHYRVYEGRLRGWLDSPAPVVYRNGTVVAPDEYVIQPAYGVIVFPIAQSPDDIITADFTHVTGDSKTISDLITATERIGGLEAGIGALEADIGALGTRVDDIQASAGGDGSTGGTVSLPDSSGVGPFYTSGSYVSHQTRNYSTSSTVPDTKTHTSAFNVLVNAGTVDAFPFPLSNKTAFNKATIMLGTSTATAVRVRIGIYSDKDGVPDKLIYGTPDIIVSPGKWASADIALTLDTGFYWIARQDKSNSQWNGLNHNSVETIQIFDGDKFLRDLADPIEYTTHYGGFRATGVSWTDGGTMPSTYPASGALFQRASYGTPWLIVK